MIGRSTDTARNGGATVDYSYGGSFVLGNGADSIALLDAHGLAVDEVSWDRGATWIRPNGASMALVDGGWCESGPQFGAGDRGTPGAANDCTPLPHRDVVINEVHIDPNAVSDTAGEWFELYNATDSAIDINGWVLRDDDYDAHTITAGGALLIQPGEAIAPRPRPVDQGQRRRDRRLQLRLGLPAQRHDRRDLAPRRRPRAGRSRDVDGVPPASGGARGERVAARSGGRQLRPGELVHVGDHVRHMGRSRDPGAANTCEIEPPATSTTTTTTLAPTTTSTTTTTTTHRRPRARRHDHFDDIDHDDTRRSPR